jgi:hypothetical protein
MIQAPPWYTSFLALLLNESGKLEFLSLTSIYSQLLCNTLAYWASSLARNKMKCCEYDPWCGIHKFFFLCSLRIGTFS